MSGLRLSSARRRSEYQHVIAVAYLLCGFSDLHRLSKNHIVYVGLARKVFGREYMKIVGNRVQSLLREWGYMRDRYADPRSANHL